MLQIKLFSNNLKQVKWSFINTFKWAICKWATCKQFKIVERFLKKETIKQVKEGCKFPFNDLYQSIKLIKLLI